MKNNFTEVSAKTENTCTVAERIERLYWLLTAAGMLADNISMDCIAKPYNAEETAEAIRAITWSAHIELGAIQGAAEETKVTA